MEQSKPMSAAVHVFCKEFIALLVVLQAGAPHPASAQSTVDEIRQRGFLVFNDGSTFQQLTGNPVANVRIFTARVDSGSRTVLTGPGNIDPSWTPDGRIIFVSDRSGSPQIWIMDADGRKPRQIGSLHQSPVHSPQQALNGLIVFEMAGGVWAMQPDGSGLRQIVRDGAAPSLALSGGWLTFTRGSAADHTGEHNEIFRIGTDGGALQQLTFPGDPNYPDANATAISPDETLVAFFSGKESDPATGVYQDVTTFGYRNIAIIPATGGVRRTLTTCHPIRRREELRSIGPADCIAADNPAWSPDSRRIIYDRSSGQTWMIDPNGQNEQVLYPATRGGGKFPLKLVN
jgi:Tol biopolymer transport system component